MDRLDAHQRSEVMSRIGRKNTTPELAARAILSRLGVRFRLHAKELPGRPDIVNRKRRFAIFVHGCFWHGHHCKRGKRPEANSEFWNTKLDRNRLRDQTSVRALRKLGWRVMTIWECELKTRDSVQTRIAAFIKGL